MWADGRRSEISVAFQGLVAHYGSAPGRFALRSVFALRERVDWALLKMHDGEVDIDAGLVGELVATQFPHLADLPIKAVRSTGTVNAIYRIGDHLCARLPRLGRWVEGLMREQQVLPLLAPGLSLRVPVPVASGSPTSSYPLTACANHGE